MPNVVSSLCNIKLSGTLKTFASEIYMMEMKPICDGDYKVEGVILFVKCHLLYLIQLLC